MSNMLKYIGYCTSFVLFEHKLNVDGGLGERRQKHTIIETKTGNVAKNATLVLRQESNLRLCDSGAVLSPLIYEEICFWEKA